MSLLYGISTACEVWDQDAGPAFWGKGTPLSGMNYDPKSLRAKTGMLGGNELATSRRGA